jgi:hypothetical protein
MNLRAYLAVIKDSFREAVASRVLWVLLAVITVILLVLAPLGVKRHLTTKFVPPDIVDVRQFVSVLRNSAAAPADTATKRIWLRFDDDARVDLLSFLRGGKGGGREYLEAAQKLIAQLNQLLDQEDLYSESAWAGVSLPGEAKELLGKPWGQLKQEERERRNRLLIEAPLRSQLRPRGGESASITFLGFDPFGPLPFTPKQLKDNFERFGITTLMSFLVGILAVMTAILVTSPIVPRMFEPGSIHLLLSKPISRSLLFIAKFIGGCAFILLNVAYLIVGLWLILGFRLGLWNHRLLLCIPVFLFLFAIYYAVSSLAGLLWKNAIVSVVVTIIFWAGCFIVGVAKVQLEDIFFSQRRIVRIASVGDDLLAIREDRSLRQWNPTSKDWQTLQEPTRPDGLPTMIGPLWHPATDKVLVAFGWKGVFGLGGTNLNLQVGSRENGWRLQPGPTLPTGTTSLVLEPDGGLLAIGSGGIFRLQGDLAAASEPVKLFGFALPLTNREPFVRVLESGGQGEPEIAEPSAAVINPSSQELVIVSRNRIYRLARAESGQYRLVASAELAGDENDGSALAAGANTLLVARESGVVLMLDAQSLETVRTSVPDRYSQPRFVALSPDGHWATILFQNRRLWRVDLQARQLDLAAVPGQGDISAAGFDRENRLMVVDRLARVRQYDPASQRQLAQFSPPLDRWETLFYYLITPVYNVFPKPGELDNTVQYILTKQSTAEVGFLRGNIELPREQRDPWRPLWSSAVFMLVVLSGACFYIERSEF